MEPVSIPVDEKRRGRPPGAIFEAPVPVRLTSVQKTALDAYAAQQPEPKPSRSEMIRKILEDRLVHEGLIEAGPEVGTTT